MGQTRQSRGSWHTMRVHLPAVALIFLMILVGCASIIVPDPSTKSPAEQEQDRAECAAVAARAAQDYAWDPLADLEAVRADREAECLESRGYIITTKVYMRPSTDGDQPRQAQPDPVRRAVRPGGGDGPLRARLDDDRLRARGRRTLRRRGHDRADGQPLLRLPVQGAAVPS